MRANEFVANKIYQESLLTEEFKVSELTQGYGKGYGVFDAEGNLVREFSNEADAKNFARIENKKLYKAGDEAGHPKKSSINKGVSFLKGVWRAANSGKWAVILGATATYIDLIELNNRITDLYTYIRHKTNICSGQSPGRLLANDPCLKLYALAVAEQKASLYWALGTAAAGFLAGNVLIIRMLIRTAGAFNPIAGILIWLGVEAAIIAINALFSEKYYHKLFPAFRRHSYNNHVKGVVLHRENIKALCTGEIETYDSIDDIVVKQPCATNESITVEAQSLQDDNDLESVMKDIMDNDPIIQELYQKAMKRKESGAARLFDNNLNPLNYNPR